MNDEGTGAPGLQRGRWLRIAQVGTFHDIPRAIVLLDREFVFCALDCPFDESKDDYADEYAVYRIGHDARDAKTWFQRSASAPSPDERIHISHLEFDETRRHLVFVHARPQPPGSLGHPCH